jgi:hypothetical protein
MVRRKATKEIPLAYLLAFFFFCFSSRRIAITPLENTKKKQEPWTKRPCGSPR